MPRFSQMTQAKTEPTEPPASSQTSVAEQIELVCRHAINGVEVKVVLPQRAKFKHVKKALAKHLDSDEIETRGQLMKKQAGIYTAYKDNNRIGDVRELLVVCADLGTGGQATLSDGEVSAAEDEAPKKLGEGTLAEKKQLRPGTLSLEQALALQRDLCDGFAADDFQEELCRLVRQQTTGIFSQTEFLQERQNLFLTVQRRVLPNYGFEGTLSGVYKMMGALGPFVKDKEFIRIANQINDLLGISSPPETWGNLSKSCAKFDDKPEPKKKPLAKPVHRLGMGGSLGRMGLGRFSELTSPLGPGLGRPFGGPAGGPAAAAPAQAGGQEFAPPPRDDASGSAGPSAEELGFDPWPANRPQPCALSVAGSWTNWKAEPMQFDNGMFIAPVTIGKQGSETFQLLQDGKFEKCIYPDRPEANPYEEHLVCGPDSRGHGKDWKIGKFEEDQAKPGASYCIIAIPDKTGKVQVVAWQPI